MSTLVLMLALLGGAALAGRLLRALLRLALRTAEVTASAGLVEISMRRGDLTTLMERREAVRVARRGRRRDLLLSLLWVAWLVVPVFTAWPREVYALAAPLWLLPTPRLRAGRPPPTEG